jgi:hypothetical protein
MLLPYKYINHEIEKFQRYLDFLFLEVWSKARGPFNSSKLNQLPELKSIYEILHFDDGDWAFFFNSHIELIYDEFLKIGRPSRKELRRWYRINNKIHSLCINTSLEPINYKSLEVKYPRLKNLLKTFYSRLYDSKSPFLLAVFGNLRELKKSHYAAFIDANFDGHEGVCHFCGLNSIKGNDHNTIEAYDHFIPKGNYPFNSINFKNLVPICDECNSYYKLQKNPLWHIDPIAKNNKRRKAFYPYSKDSWKLNFKVELQNIDFNALRKEEIKINVTATNKNDEVLSWMEVYGIKERYTARILGKHAGRRWYIDLIEGITFLRKKFNKPDLTVEDYLNLKYHECDQDLLSSCNFLKKAFLEECYRSGIVK